MSQNKSVILTFDVEDWFQVENFHKSIPFSSWPDREMRVEANTRRILDCLDSFGAAAGPCRATFFILGWLAERVPSLVREIHSRGHEIASHGFSHNLCSRHTPSELRADISDSRKLLEDITGEAVLGYRAPNFSVDRDVLKIVKECGHAYDSSYNSFSANGRYGKLDLVQNGTGIACELSAGFFELPISNMRIGKMVIPIGGGGYFRLIPSLLFLKAVRSVLDKQAAYLFYLHPWEVDPEQPRVTEAPRSSRFRHYLNLHRTMPRLRYLLNGLSGFNFLSCRDYLARVGG